MSQSGGHYSRYSACVLSLSFDARIITESAVWGKGCAPRPLFASGMRGRQPVPRGEPSCILGRIQPTDYAEDAMPAQSTAEIVLPKTLDAAARQELLDGLYAVHCQIFDGVEKA